MLRILRRSNLYIRHAFAPIVLLVLIALPLSSSLFRRSHDLSIGWRPIRQDAIKYLPAEQQYLLSSDCTQHLLQDNIDDVAKGLIRSTSSSLPKSNSDEEINIQISNHNEANKQPAHHVNEHEHNEQKVTEEQPFNAESKYSASSNIPRYIFSNDFQTDFDKFPDNRFQSGHGNDPSSSLFESPEDPPSPSLQVLEDDSDIPDPDMASQVNAMADWSRVQEGDSSILELLIERGLQLIPVPEIPWRNSFKGDLFEQSHSDLYPVVFRDSPVQNWTILSWQTEDWRDNIKSLPTVSVSSRRGMIYYGNHAICANLVHNKMSMGIEAWTAPGVPNPNFQRQFGKDGLPMSLIPFYRPPHGVKTWPSIDDLFQSIGTDKWLYGYSRVNASVFRHLKPFIPSWEEMLARDDVSQNPAFTFWVGTNAPIAICHYDSSNIYHGSLLGTKRFYYMPQSEIPNMYLHPLHHPSYRNSFVCLSCPTQRKDAEQLLMKFPNLLKVKEIQYVDVEPGSVVVMPAFWLHEVSCQSELCISFSSSKNVPDIISLAEDRRFSLLPFLDHVWDMQPEEQLKHVQAFFLTICPKIMRGTKFRGSDKESTCLKSVVRNVLQTQYEPLGVLSDLHSINLPCPPLQQTIRALDQPKTRAKIMDVIEKHMTVISLAWDQRIKASPARYPLFMSWLLDSLSTRMEWYELPIWMSHCFS